MQLTVYSRPECGLCDEMIDALAGLLAGRDWPIEIVDVDSDPALAERYGLRIPVLCVDGDFVCAYRLDVDRVRRRLELED
ncbi:MAG TPA: glutaredoxin family protein [Steroidobacteraceae bacterium]|nr:glutaredoxin family protein [Steroidobacteraceae bacterium]